MKAFDLPPYPYDRLNELRALAAEKFGAAIDMSIGTPYDAPPPAVVAALSSSNAERGYPPSPGTLDFRTAASTWLDTQFGVSIEPSQIGATMGLKEFVAGLPHLLRLKDPSKDTVLYPAVSYPSYAMGADLAHGRSVAVPVDEHWRLRLDQIDPADIARAIVLWVDSPGNPAGALQDLPAVAAWGRANGVPIASDECYIEFTWNGPPKTILQSGVDGVLSVHSLSKRSNLAGVRAGFYTGDPELVRWLTEIRKHTGAMVPGPNQAASVVAFSDQEHVVAQRDLYEARLRAMVELFTSLGIEANMPEGGFYVWAKAPDGDAWALARRLAEDAGVIVSPGEFYGPPGAGHVRVAVVQPIDAIALAAERLTSSSS